MAEQQRAYQPGYQPKQVRHHEWRTAENSAEQLVPVLKERAEKNPKLTLLDVGSGSGTIATSLAKYIPEGNVTATDLSDDIMKRAEQLAREAGITNVTFQQADAYHLPFPDESFDVVHTSQMLIHMDEPQNAIKELVRVAKKGGVISCREGDLPLMVYWPEIPAQQRFQKLAVTLHDLTAGKSTCGRQLVGLALKAGVKRDQIQASWHTWCYSSPEEREIISKQTFMLISTSN